MEIVLQPSWILTTEHITCLGQPVLVNRKTNKTYDPNDVLKPHPSWGYMTAADAVKRMMRTADLDLDKLLVVERFLNQGLLQIIRIR